VPADPSQARATRRFERPEGTRTPSGRHAAWQVEAERSAGNGEKRGDTLTIRWFTPRGRATRQELLDDLRFEDGAHLRELLADVRRDGLAENTLDLRGIDLRGEDLASARLTGADLTGARLDGCNLSHADLRGTYLDRANLTGARLRGAALTGARLREAVLEKADLLEANLERSDLDGARCAGATFHRARLWGAQLGRAELSGVDLSTALRERAAFVDPRPTTAKRQAIGSPPPTEPRRPTERLVATRRLPPPAGQLITHETVKMARAESGERTHDDFEAAVAELLALRGRTQRITIVVDGRERVLFLGEENARVTVRVG
jgi:uncharacterized protein YjbI with pentapeptide repeats